MCSGLTGNEWKTRYETQQEMNQQLEKGIILLQNKVEEARKNLREGKSSILFLFVKLQNIP